MLKLKNTINHLKQHFREPLGHYNNFMWVDIYFCCSKAGAGSHSLGQQFSQNQPQEQGVLF